MSCTLPVYSDAVFESDDTWQDLDLELLHKERSVLNLDLHKLYLEMLLCKRLKWKKEEEIAALVYFFFHGL